MTPDLEFTHCVPCPSCGRQVAAGTRCPCQPLVRPESRILCARWGGVAGEAYKEPDRLDRLLERAAVIAARAGSPACPHLRRAIEATKEEK